MPESLAGPAERLSEHNPENGFAVSRVKIRGVRDAATAAARRPVMRFNRRRTSW
jgi:hypothetical protein